MLMTTYFIGAVAFGARDRRRSAGSRRPPTTSCCLAGVGFANIVAQFCVIRSLKLASASVVVPYQYTLIVWSVVFGWQMFGELPDAYTIVGAAIIVAAGLYIFWREQVTARRAPAVPAEVRMTAQSPALRHACRHRADARSACSCSASTTRSANGWSRPIRSAQFLLIRSATTLILLTPFIWRAGRAAFSERAASGLQVLRAACCRRREVVLFFWAVGYLPLADAITFYLAGPIYVTALSALLLKESVGWRRWTAVLVGFLGVVIALRPSAAT